MSGEVASLIVAYQAERFLGEALASVFAQTTLPTQVVVVDDGSTDATADLAAADPRVEVLRLEHGGAAIARTAGFARCDRDLVALLDADDVWLPTKLERQLAAMDADVDAVFCRADEFVEAGTDAAAAGIRSPRLGVDAPIPSAALLRRELFDRVGPFSTDRLTVGDWIEWWSRARAAGVREVTVPEVLLRRRLHDANNSSARAAETPGQLLRTVRAHLRAKDDRGPDEE